MSGTLGHVCNTVNWGSPDGIMICRIYKALFSFTVTGLITAVAAVWLDLRVRRTQTRSGVYNRMGADAARTRDFKMGGLGGLVNHVAASMPSSQTVSVEPYRNEGHEPVQQQERFYGQKMPWRAQGGVEDLGYAAPSEQTSYDAGTYGYGDRH